jgi:hypothetical protein
MVSFSFFLPLNSGQPKEMLLPLLLKAIAKPQA